jgi:mannose-1-phosphate guanylyltransferase
LPKQFASIVPGGSLFEGAVKRNLELGSDFIVAANEGQSSLAAAQLEELGVAGYASMVEPVGRNTAPAIALACMMLPPGEVALVVPSDHLIKGLAEYQAAVLRGTELARSGRLVTFGIAPTYAETGYGYIETDGERVVSFKEKPDLATAEGYAASGRHFWNSGMFCFMAGTFLSELEACSPAVYAACLKAYDRAQVKSPLRPAREDMAAIPSISIDYAVMEKSELVSCVLCPPALGWSDLGSYDALFEELSTSVPTVPSTSVPTEASNIPGNVTIGAPGPVTICSGGNLVVSSGKRVVLVGVDDLVIVDTPDALLVARRGSTQLVKDAVEALKGIEPGLL